MAHPTCHVAAIYCDRRSRTRSSNSDFATPPPGSTSYMRWKISGHLRKLEMIPLSSAPTSAPVPARAIAAAPLARAIAAAPLACSHRRSTSCRCGHRPLRSALVARHRRPAHLLRLHLVACGCPSFSSLARALARCVQALLSQRGHRARQRRPKGRPHSSLTALLILPVAVFTARDDPQSAFRAARVRLEPLHLWRRRLG